MTTEKDKALEHAEANACGWLETIREHVACLEADRDRLEELRDERQAIVDYVEETAEADAKANNAQANEQLKEWDEENAEELADLEKAVTLEGEECDEDTIRQRIEESPLSVEVRSDWHTPGSQDETSKPAEYCILLSTGGPALRIIGELDQYCQPSSARLEYQDWFTPWTEKITTGDDHAALLRWAQVFYFGD